MLYNSTCIITIVHYLPKKKLFISNILKICSNETFAPILDKV